jgi:hypothetical protein
LKRTRAAILALACIGLSLYLAERGVLFSAALNGLAEYEDAYRRVQTLVAFFHVAFVVAQITGGEILYRAFGPEEPDEQSTGFVNRTWILGRNGALFFILTLVAALSLYWVSRLLR